MRRREVLKMAALSSLISAHPSFLSALEAPASTAALPIRKVLLVTKCHLDVGFSLTQSKVMREYFDIYYPTAVSYTHLTLPTKA